MTDLFCFLDRPVILTGSFATDLDQVALFSTVQSSDGLSVFLLHSTTLHPVRRCITLILLVNQPRLSRSGQDLRLDPETTLGTSSRPARRRREALPRTGEGREGGVRSGREAAWEIEERVDASVPASGEEQEYVQCVQPGSWCFQGRAGLTFDVFTMVTVIEQRCVSIRQEVATDPVADSYISTDHDRIQARRLHPLAPTPAARQVISRPRRRSRHLFALPTGAARAQGIGRALRCFKLLRTRRE